MRIEIRPRWVEAEVTVLVSEGKETGVMTAYMDPDEAERLMELVKQATARGWKLTLEHPD